MGCGSSNDVKQYRKEDSSIWQGKLTIGLRKATLKKEFSYIGAIDPYVKFKFGKQQAKSETIDEGGQFPVWKNQEFQFTRLNEDDIVHVSIWDENIIKDDFLGEGGFALTKVRKGTNGKVDTQCELYGDGEHIGTIELELEFELDPQSRNHPEVLAPDTLGTAIVRPQSACLQQDNSGYFSSLNPICVVRLGDDNQASGAHIEGGQNPKWSDQLIFTRDTIARDTFILECYSFNDSGDNILLGVGWASFSSILPKDSKVEKTSTLYLEGEEVGTITVDMEFVSDDPAAYGGQQQQAQPVQQQQQQQPVQQQQQQPQHVQQKQQYVPPQPPQRPQNGQASYTYPNGSTYSGNWMNGMRNGQGKFTQMLPNGQVATYEGGFENDQYHGVGRYVTPSWSYEGSWVNGKKDGNGMQTWSNSLQRYGGGWANNNYHGEGEWTDAQGVTKVVIYNYGKFVRYAMDEQEQQGPQFQHFISAGQALRQNQKLYSNNGQYYATISRQGCIRVFEGHDIIFEIDDFEDSDEDMDKIMEEEDNEDRRQRIRELMSEDNRAARNQRRRERRKQRGGRGKRNRDVLRGRGGRDREEEYERQGESLREKRRRKRELRRLMQEEKEREREREYEESDDEVDIEPPFMLKLEQNGELVAKYGKRQKKYWSSFEDDDLTCAQGTGGLKLVVRDTGDFCIVDKDGNDQCVING